jgi:hypothetical protein
VLACAIPFEERELRMMERGALTITKGSGKFDDSPLASRQ